MLKKSSENGEEWNVLSRSLIRSFPPGSTGVGKIVGSVFDRIAPPACGISLEI